MNSMSYEGAGPKTPSVPTSDEFTRAMGQVVWLMTLSTRHRDLPISKIESMVSTPLMFKQVRIFTKGKQPLAAVLWAYASEEIKALLKMGGYEMQLQDWRSGPDIVVVDCVSPLMDSKLFVEQFMNQVDSAKANQK